MRRVLSYDSTSAYKKRQGFLAMNLSPALKQNHVQNDIHKSPEVYCTEYMGFYLGIGINSQMGNYTRILPFPKHEVIKN